jgi:hypothetical protein
MDSVPDANGASSKPLPDAQFDQKEGHSLEYHHQDVWYQEGTLKWGKMESVNNFAKKTNKKALKDDNKPPPFFWSKKGKRQTFPKPTA